MVGITAGTPTVFGFTAERRKRAGKQFVDVGIAEEHAVAIARSFSVLIAVVLFLTCSLRSFILFLSPQEYKMLEDYQGNAYEFIKNKIDNFQYSDKQL